MCVCVCVCYEPRSVSATASYFTVLSRFMTCFPCKKSLYIYYFYFHFYIYIIFLHYILFNFPPRVLPINIYIFKVFNISLYNNQIFLAFRTFLLTEKWVGWTYHAAWYLSGNSFLSSFLMKSCNVRLSSSSVVENSQFSKPLCSEASVRYN